MGVEGPHRAEKPVNWNEILRHSYMFSQGHEVLQKQIFAWLAHQPFATKPTSNDFKRDLTATYAYKSGAHQTFALGPKDFAEDETRKVAELTEAMEDPGTESPSFATLTRGMIGREFDYLVENHGRHPEGKSSRDPWSSFIIDFGILEKGTGPWSWDATPEVYKKMWQGIVHELSQGTYEGLNQIIDAYLAHHPDLPIEDRARIEAFRTASPTA